MELRLSPEGVQEMEAILETGHCSVTTVASVKTHQYLQPNHHVCAAEETTGCGVAKAFKILELRNVGMSQRKRSFAFVV